jgi:hypothetical protein
VGILACKLCHETNEPIDPLAPMRRPALHHFLLVILAVVAFIYAAPTAGFIVTAAAVSLLLLRVLGARWTTSAVVSAGLSMGVYEVFGHLLRVPLPQGWLGW